ncbi:MAG: twin-arginine translocase TatA/TatE family subunit [Caldithrix sp.]|nr:twin-arginine translocase TatA/TatE family subunit [Caldithrix sp.]
MNFGFTEILIIFLIIMVLFGAKRIPELARSLGSSVKSFKKGIEEADQEEADNQQHKKE